MENQVCPSPRHAQEERSLTLSEDSCSECSCEACCNVDSGAEENTNALDFNFTKIKDMPKDVLPTTVGDACVPSQSLPVLQTLVSSRPTENLTVAIEDLHMRQSSLKMKKQRRCSFCRIHGFPVNIKGHKAFCQFREKCMCKGCALIRCNQQVSKNQVRLRRQKDMEADFVQLAPNSMEQQPTLESMRKNPMCFKCWVHDSVRVRLKGHRNICPYARCSCPNCALNTDRKRLTRELRQLTGTGGDLDRGEVGRQTVLGGFGCLHLPSESGLTIDQQHNINANVLLSNTTAGPSGVYKDNGLSVTPVQLHKAGDWQFSSIVSPTAGLKQESGHFQGLLSGVPPYHASTLSLKSPVFQEPGSLLPDGKWLPDLCSIGPASSYSTVGRSQGSVFAANSNYHNGIGISNNGTSRAGQDNSLYSWLPQHTCIKASDTAAVLQSNTSGYTAFCPPYLPPRYQSSQAK